MRALVAARDIPLRTVIGAGDVVLRDVSPDAVPAGWLTNPQEVIGKLTTSDLARGEVILRQRLLAPDYVGPQAAFVMDPRKILIAFPARDLLSSVDIVRPGDRIDLMFSCNLGKDNPNLASDLNTVTALQDVQVAGIIYGTQSEQQKNAARPAAQAILLAVDPQDALTIKHFCDAGAVADLALRSPAAEGLFETIPVDGEYLMKRYQIHWWAKR